VFRLCLACVWLVLGTLTEQRGWPEGWVGGLGGWCVRYGWMRGRRDGRMDRRRDGFKSWFH